MPSSGASFDAPLITAGRLLAERGVYGLVWIDEDLVTRARYGRIVDFVEIGAPITDSVYAFVGLEDELRSLKSSPGAVLDLPGVSLKVGAAAETDPRRERMNFTAFWSEGDQAYLLVVAGAGLNSALEVELSRQMRARLMAEDELLIKSRALECANSELLVANEDLDAYAAIISHDLKAPMRTLRHLADDLEGALLAGQSGEARKRLDDLRHVSRRMSGMLSALLDYSSVTRKSELAEAVDTRALVEAVIAALRIPSGSRVEIAGHWPVIETIASPLDLVLRNLIENAIKHHDREAVLVIVSARVRGEIVEITVSDDGPGIAPEHREAAFLPFRKLGERETEGFGMGLALVSRMVERIGGTIELESAAPSGRGATFKVLWPITIGTKSGTTSCCD